MKKSSIFLLISLIPSLLFAGKAFWAGSPTPMATWSGTELLAFTDQYEEGSEISVSTPYSSVIVKVAGGLPRTVPGRDLALTERAMKELGIWGEGVTEVEIKLRKGSVKDTPAYNSGSGWYSFTLEEKETREAYQLYLTLIKKGFKPRSEITGNGTVIFTLPFIVEYERDEKRNIILSMGVRIEKEEETENPYL